MNSVKTVQQIATESYTRLLSFINAVGDLCRTVAETEEQQTESRLHTVHSMLQYFASTHSNTVKLQL